MEQTTPAGWYPHPLGLGKEAFWDGQQWQFSRLNNLHTEQPAKRKPVNKTLHLVLTIVTLGLWMPIWTIVLLTRLSEDS